MQKMACAADIATCILEQLTLDDGEREFPRLKLFLAARSIEPFGGKAMAALNFSVYQGVPSFVVTVEDSRVRTKCPVLAAKILCGAAVWFPHYTATERPVTAVVMETKSPKYTYISTVIASEGCHDNDQLESIKRLANALAPLLLNISDLEIH